jgi:hypothetical protein
MADTRTSVLIDGTALYFRSREGRTERLDYEALDSELQMRSSVGRSALERLRNQGASGSALPSMPPFDPVIFFTTYDSKNDGQTKFLSYLRSKLAWQVETKPIWDADPLPIDAPWERNERRNQYIRFDAAIAFALGRLVERRKRIIVVTDSFALAQPMLAASEYGTQIVLAFFGQQIDPRWMPVVKESKSNSGLQFWDLSDSSQPIFGKEVGRVAIDKSALTRLK